MGFSVNRRNSLRSPACAGKSLPEYRHVLRAGDHPRVCGEKKEIGEVFKKNRGSPPRVRGKVHYFSTQICMDRITPACAGKSTPAVKRHGRAEDHPRVCGEKLQKPSEICLDRGSPPRVRGKVINIFPASAFMGITPACAGKSALEHQPTERHWDHPRVCGEKQ